MLVSGQLEVWKSAGMQGLDEGCVEMRGSPAEGVAAETQF